MEANWANMNRRRLLQASGAALLAGSTFKGGPVFAQDLRTIRITQPSESMSYLSVYAARSLGLFKEVGLEPEIVIVRGDGPDVQALLAGEVDFVATPPHHLYTLYQQDRPLWGVCSLLGRLGISVVLRKDVAAEKGVDENSPFEEKLAALEGLTIGCSTPGSLTFNVATYYIKRAGLVPQQDAQVVPAGGGPSAIAAMENGIVDGYAYSTPLTNVLVQRGIGTMLINNLLAQDPEMDEFLHAVLYARPDYLTGEPELVRNTVGALVQAQGWIHSHSDAELGELVRPYFANVDESIYVDAIGNVKAGIPNDGRMTARGSDNFQKLLIEAGHIDSMVEFDKVFTNDFLPEA